MLYCVLVASFVVICHLLGLFLACFVFWHVLNDFATIVIAIYEGKLRFATQIIAISGKNRNNLYPQ